jgi:hypothetical protein
MRGRNRTSAVYSVERTSHGIPSIIYSAKEERMSILYLAVGIVILFFTMGFLKKR